MAREVSVFKKLLAAILPVSTALAVFATATPVQAALPDCVLGGGRITIAGDYSNCQVTGNSGAVVGGAVFNSGTMTLTNVLISGNSATALGGGIWNSGVMTLTNVTITGNAAGGAGGGIWNSGSSLKMTGVTIAGNSGSDGGGIWNNGSSLKMTGVTIGGTAGGTSNHATGSGGGLWNNGVISSASTGLTIEGNISGADGGGIWNNGAATVATGTISSNTANNNANGGGIWNNGSVDLTSFTLGGNTAAHNGGAIFNSGIANVAQSTIGDANQAGQNGGGVWNSNSYRMIQTGLQNNTATQLGGGLYMENGTADLNSDTISGNHAGGDGGGIYVSSSTIEGTTLDLHLSAAQSQAVKPHLDNLLPAPNITISGNTADLNGGGIAMTDPQSGGALASFLNATIADNKATGTNKLGGGVWLKNSNNLLEIQSTLIARNLPQNCKDDGSGQIAEPGTPDSANLDTGNTCELDTGANATDQINVANPKLGPLADNFGFTKTQALLFSSPAIDTVPAAGGCPTVPPVDERGTTRPQATLCDIGAYECIGATPNVTQVAPNSGPIAGGTNVTITGTGFDRPSSVSFGGVPASNVVVNSPTQITATSPPGTGTAPISVQTCRANSVAGFTFLAPALPAAGAALPSSPLTWAWLLLLLVIGGPAAGLLAFAYRPERRG